MIPKIENFIKNKHVDIKISTDDGIAKTSEIKKDCYEINYNKIAIEKILEESWLYNSISYDELETGIMLHEYAHIIFTDFKILKSNKNNAIIHTIFNILEDSRIEYQMVKKYPTISLYYEIVLATLRDEIDSTRLSTYGMSKKNANETKEDLENIYNIVRFNRSNKPIGEFESIVFCIAKSIKNNDCYNCYIASKVIYKLLLEKNKIDNNVIPRYNHTITTKKANNKEFVDNLMKSTNNNLGDSFDVDKLSSAIQSNKNKKQEMQKNNDKENKIYNYVIANYSDIINKIRQIFKHIVSKKVLADSYDGEIDLKKQQDIYLSEKLGESGMFYKINKTAKEGADVIICRDISGSTRIMSKEYAEIICTILAALEKINNVNTCLIDFESRSNIVKNFNQSVSECSIEALSFGSTNAAGALSIIKENIKFKNSKRLCIVVSDGRYDSIDDFNKIKKELELKFNLVFLEILINDRNGIKLIELPKIIYRFILTELKK